MELHHPTTVPSTSSQNERNCYSRPIVLNKAPPQRGIITKIIKNANKPLKALIASQTSNIYQQHPLILNEYTSKPTTLPFYKHSEVRKVDKRFGHMEIDKSADFALVTHSSSANSNNSVAGVGRALKVCCNSNFGLLNSSVNSFRNKTSAPSVLSPYTVNNSAGPLSHASISHSQTHVSDSSIASNKSKQKLAKNKREDTNTSVSMNMNVRSYYVSTPCTKKIKSKINWSKLSKFILNQPSSDNNCIKKITLEQITHNKKKPSADKHVQTKKRYLKKQNTIWNIKHSQYKTQRPFPEKNLTDNNNISSTAMTGSNSDSGSCNVIHKYNVSPKDNTYSCCRPKTTLFSKTNLTGNRSDLCLKHSTDRKSVV